MARYRSTNPTIRPLCGSGTGIWQQPGRTLHTSDGRDASRPAGPTAHSDWPHHHLASRDRTRLWNARTFDRVSGSTSAGQRPGISERATRHRVRSSQRSALSASAVGTSPLYGTRPPPLNGSIGPIQPVPIYPNGFGWGNDGAIGYERLFQDTGGLYTYLYGDPISNGNELEINEIEVFTSAVWKNFLHSPHDLRITPGFIFDFLAGPAVPGKIALPAQLYCTPYLNFLWQPQLTPQFGAEY